MLTPRTTVAGAKAAAPTLVVTSRDCWMSGWCAPRVSAFADGHVGGSAVGSQVVRVGAALVGAVLVVTGCTSGEGSERRAPPLPSASVSASSGAGIPVEASPSPEPSGQSVAGAEVPPEVAATLTDEELAAAGEAAAAYRNAELESHRYVRLAIEQAAERGGVPVQTPELREMLAAVVVGPEFSFITQNPQAVQSTWPTIASLQGGPEVLRVQVADAELYGEPTAIDMTDGITGVVTLRSCVDVSGIRAFDAESARLDVDDPPVRILTWEAVMWKLSHPLTGVEGWYLADMTGEEGTSCQL